ncbi:hypothetical protein AAHE18_09G110800 [Arachis hypogaea]
MRDVVVHIRKPLNSYRCYNNTLGLERLWPEGDKNTGGADGVHGPAGEIPGRIYTGSVQQILGWRSVRRLGFGQPTNDACAPGDLRELGAAIPKAGEARICPNEGWLATACSDPVCLAVNNIGDDCWENGVRANRGEGGRVGQGSTARLTTHECQPRTSQSPAVTCWS